MSDKTAETAQKEKLREHAHRMNDHIAALVQRRRLAYMGLVIASALAGIALMLFEQYVFGLCGLGLAVVFGIRALDAHEHLREVRRRPAGILFPGMSRILKSLETSGHSADPTSGSEG